MRAAAGRVTGRGFFVSWCFGALALVAALACQAGSFTANPVRLTLQAGETSTSLLLENKGDQPALIQDELMAWSQKDGMDVLTPSQDVVVSPPIFKVAPGAAQTVRIGLLKPADRDREITYRLFLQEVAQPPAPGQQGVSVSLRLGLPIFVLPPKPAPPQLAWRAKAEGNTIRLSLTNSGNVHVQALEFKLYREDDTLIAEQQLAAYVLAGQTRSWQIEAKQPWRGGKMKITALTGEGNVKAEIIPD